MEYILAAGAGLFLVLFVLAAILAGRRRSQVQLAEKRLEEHRRQVEQLGNQLDRSRDETKKAKKNAHELEKRGRDSRPSEDTELDRIQEQALQDARSQASRAKETEIPEDVVQTLRSKAVPTDPLPEPVKKLAQMINA